MRVYKMVRALKDKTHKMYVCTISEIPVDDERRFWSDFCALARWQDRKRRRLCYRFDGSPQSAPADYICDMGEFPNNPREFSPLIDMRSKY